MRHVFRHELLDVPDVRADTTESGRVYHTADGAFPSVTTVLGRAMNDSGLVAWRERVGEDEAKRVSGRASRRGSAVHDIAERYIRNDPAWRESAMPFNLLTFEPLRSVLEQRIGAIWGIEYPLWSRRLMTAGRADIHCEWDGEPAIVDFKTSARFPGEGSEKMRKYLLQTTTYAIMASESTKINTRKIVLLFCPDDALDAVVVARERDEFAHQVETIFDPRNRDKIGLGDVVDTAIEKDRFPLRGGDSNASTLSRKERDDLEQGDAVRA